MIKLNSAIENAEAKLQGELGKVVQSVRNEYLSAQSKEKSLSSELEAQKAGALALKRKGIEYGVLRRDAESNKQIYEALLQRAKETGISGELKASNIRIVDEAENPALADQAQFEPQPAARLSRRTCGRRRPRVLHGLHRQ